MSHTKNGEIDTSWDMNFLSANWEWKDRFISLFLKMDCPERHVLYDLLEDSPVRWSN